MRPYYEDDAVTLYHGDCLEMDEWLAADVLVTDPPYGIGWSKRAGWTNATGGGASPSHDGIANDESTGARDEVLARFVGRPALVFGDVLRHHPEGARQMLVYAKSDDAGVRGAHAGFRRDIEAVFMLGPWPVTVGGSTSVLRSGARVAGPRGLGFIHRHPHAKPVDVLERLIAACPPGVVADPFAGSGSTLVAARNLGRHAIGVELEERYCEVIARRLAQDVLDFDTEAR